MSSIVERFRRSKAELSRIKLEKKQLTADATGTVVAAVVGFGNGYMRRAYEDSRELFGLDTDLVVGIAGAAAVMLGTIPDRSAGLVLNGSRALIVCASYRMGEETAEEQEEKEAA